MIPRVIHRLWLGPRPMPARFREYGRAWAELNPGWTVHDWSWHDLPEDLANQDVMDDIRARCTRGASVEMATALADVIDYELVARFGGVYANCDIQPVRPLLPPMTGGGAWATHEDPVQVVNAAFGGPAGHPFWVAVVAELPRFYWRRRAEGEEEMNQLTGPHLLTRAHHMRPGELNALPVETFNSVHFSQVPRGGTADGLWSPQTLPPGAVGIHHWHHRENGRSNVVS